MSDSLNFSGEISPLENVSQNKVLSLPIGLNGGTCFCNISLGGSNLSSGVEIFTIPHRKFSNSGENRFERDIASINTVAIKFKVFMLPFDHFQEGFVDRGRP